MNAELESACPLHEPILQINRLEYYLPMNHQLDYAKKVNALSLAALGDYVRELHSLKGNASSKVGDTSKRHWKRKEPPEWVAPTYVIAVFLLHTSLQFTAFISKR